MDLIDVYNNMISDVEEEKVAEQEENVVQERMDKLAAYAEKANELLIDEYGEGNYKEDDVTKLASLLIEHDQDYYEKQEKVSEYAQAGQIMAHSFKQELDKLAAEEQENK